jgi:hypothetical protein
MYSDPIVTHRRAQSIINRIKASSIGAHELRIFLESTGFNFEIFSLQTRMRRTIHGHQFWEQQSSRRFEQYQSEYAPISYILDTSLKAKPVPQHGRPNVTIAVDGSGDM